jgi:tetratricopeptide (TPR) repeat protein
MFRLAFILVVLFLLIGLICGSQLPEGLTTYQRSCDRVNELVKQGRFKEASLWADRTLKTKAYADPVGNIRDEILVENLLALGKYKEAERVILSLPPVTRIHTERTHVQHIDIFEMCRHESLSRAYVGQGKYQEALRELRKPIVAKTTEKAFLDFHSGKALLLLNDRDTAKQMFAKDPRHCYVKEANVYNQLLELVDEENGRANDIANAAIALWQTNHYDGVFELEFCEQVLLQKKCFYAARMLSNQVSWIKQR